MKRARVFFLSAGGAAAGLLGVAAFISACGDAENPPQVKQKPDARVVEASLPDTGGKYVPDAAALDANIDARYPSSWDRSMSARDAALEASAKYCNPNDQGVGQFCWDFTFDDGITGWQEVLEDGGKHELVGGNAGDPLRALRSTVSAEAGPGPRWVSLKYLINLDDAPDGGAGGITLSFSFRASKVGTVAMLGGIQVGTPSGPVIRGLAVYPGGCTNFPGIPCLGENDYEGTDRQGRRPFDPNAWYRTRIHLQPSGLGTGAVKWASTISVGDTVVAEHDTDGLPDTNAFPIAVNLFVGAFDTTVAGDTVVEIDDVLLE